MDAIFDAGIDKKVPRVYLGIRHPSVNENDAWFFYSRYCWTMNMKMQMCKMNSTDKINKKRHTHTQLNRALPINAWMQSDL